MSALAVILRKTSAQRPVNWRWERAGYLLDKAADHIAVHNKPPSLRRDRDQDNLVEIYLFRFAVEQCDTENDHIALVDMRPHVYEAWSIRQHKNRNTRWEMEARILSGEPFEEIARKLATSCEAVTAYEQYFFNVTDRMAAPGYLTHQVFGESLQAGLAERNFDLLWKAIGYWCGPSALDHMIYKFNKPSRPDTDSGVSALWDDHLTDAMRLKTVVAAHTMPVNQQTQEAIFAIYQRMLELERTVEGGGIGGESLMDNVRVMFDHMPWAKIETGPQGAIPTTKIEMFESQAVLLRASELTLYGQTGLPGPLQHLLSTAEYPPIEVKSHGTADGE